MDNAGPYGAGGETYDDEFANEPPLLEELGINPEHIFQKTLAVLNPFRATRADVAGDADLAGPLVRVFRGDYRILLGRINIVNFNCSTGLLSCIWVFVASCGQNSLQLHLWNRSVGMYGDIRSSYTDGNQKCQLLCDSQCPRLLYSSHSYALSIICLGKLFQFFISSFFC